MDAIQPERLAALVRRVRTERGWRAAYNLVLRGQCALAGRRPTLGLYDHALHLIGGGQKYGCLLAAAVRDRLDVTLIANRPVTVQQLAAWYGVDLTGVRVEIVPLPSFDGAAQPDPALVGPHQANPFAPVSAASGSFDLFLNNSMNELVRPLAGLALAVCHFPERRPAGRFYMDRYPTLVVNSEYTREWVRRRWGLEATTLIYPPVAGGPAPPAADKEPLILSVARFERAGSKRQLDMAIAFAKLRAAFPELTEPWRLVLAGGVEEGGNDYLRRLERAAAAVPAIRIVTNAADAEIRRLYRRAAVFWHLCGLRAGDPGLREHFGMTVAEAMRFGAVPVVYDGGGLPEIVDDGATGFRVDSSARLLERTLDLLRRPELRHELGRAGAAAAERFGLERFDAEVGACLDGLHAAWVDGFEDELRRLGR